MKTPNQQVSEQVVEALQKEKLLKEGSIKGLADKLAAGQMTANDWKVLFKLEATEKADHAKNKA